jgi:hypothetical protein
VDIKQVRKAKPPILKLKPALPCPDFFLAKVPSNAAISDGALSFWVLVDEFAATSIFML